MALERMTSASSSVVTRGHEYVTLTAAADSATASTNGTIYAGTPLVSTSTGTLEPFRFGVRPGLSREMIEDAPFRVGRVTPLGDPILVPNEDAQLNRMLLESENTLPAMTGFADVEDVLPPIPNKDYYTKDIIPYEDLMEEGKKTDDFCGICYRSIFSKQKVFRCPHCEQAYHLAGIDTWLDRSDVCPKCREVITKKPKKRSRLEAPPRSMLSTVRI